jgi:hypothetical protein
MRALGLTAAVIGWMLLAPAQASARGGDNPPEIGIGAGQLLIGTATASVFLALPAFSNNSPFETIAYVALATGPAAVGGMVCTFGKTSKNYRGTCLPVLAGAYLGALAAAPLAWIASAVGGGSFDNGDGGKNFTSGPAIGFAIGYAVGAAGGATVAWHWTKEERDIWSHLGTPPVPPGVESQRWFDLGARPSSGPRAASAGRAAPLLAFTF